MPTLIDISLVEISQPLPSARILISGFLAVLFLQSGLDKVFDWEGNLSWLKGHFAKSPLKNFVPIMLGAITIFEVSAGLTSLAGVFMLLFTGSTGISMIGAQLAALSLLMLFFGQRIAKDYEGAATLVSYFILAILGILTLSDVFLQ